MAKKIFPLLIVFLIALLSSLSLFHAGFPPTHDGEYHAIRFYEFDTAIRDGDLYPRWAKDLNNGYGVPLFNFVYPLPNYISFFTHLVGINFLDSFKVSMILATFVGGWGFYFWSKRYWGDSGGVVSAAFYLYAPYRFVDIYVRGSIGEVWALALFPGLLYSIDKVLHDKNKKFVIPSGIFLAFLVFSHNILALMFFIVLFFYIGIIIWKQDNKKESVITSSISVFLGLSLSAPFWLPALLEKQYTQGLQIYSVTDNFPDLASLLIPSWGTGFTDDSLGNQMSLQIGVANLLIVLITTFLLLIWIKKKQENKHIIVFFSVLFYVTFFLMLPVSKILWKIMPLFNYFQFPWRFLSVEIITCAFLAGFVVNSIKQKKLQVVLAGFFILLVILLGHTYTKLAYYHMRDDNYYTSRSNFIDGTNSPGNLFNTKWISKLPEKPKQVTEIVMGEGEVRVLKDKTSLLQLEVNLKTNSLIKIQKAYFPGWVGSIDGRKINLENRKGIIHVQVPKGEHIVRIKLENTIIQTISWIIFFGGIITGLFWIKVAIMKK